MGGENQLVLNIDAGGSQQVLPQFEHITVNGVNMVSGIESIDEVSDKNNDPRLIGQKVLEGFDPNRQMKFEF